MDRGAVWHALLSSADAERFGADMFFRVECDSAFLSDSS